MAKEYSKEDVEKLLHERSNWGRWGDDDQVGTVNLITDKKRVSAATLVRTGTSISLSRPFPTAPAANNPKPASHYMKRGQRGPDAGSAVDYYGLEYHGLLCTHVDALCHTWDRRGMWNGRNPDDVLSFDGSKWGTVDNWSTGIITRGVLLDVPAYRGEPYVRFEEPVHGEELEEVAKRQGVTVEPGDALVVYSGRDQWDAEHTVWGGELTEAGEPRRPGLHASCLEFLRDHDCAVLAWDMQDYMPNDWGLPWTVHGAIFAYGLPIVDHCELAPLAAHCRQENRHEFMFVLSPLVVAGGTGSPANPLAVF
jgi:kynurenine formamidase